MEANKIKELKQSDKYIEDFDELNEEALNDIEIQKEEFEKKYKDFQERMYKKISLRETYQKYLGYIPLKENPNKRKKKSRKEKARKRRIKRQSKRNNRR